MTDMEQNKTLEEMNLEELREEFFSQLGILVNAPRERRLAETERIVDIIEEQDAPRHREPEAETPIDKSEVIRFFCQQCGAEYEIDRSMFGRRVECSLCHTKFIINEETLLPPPVSTDTRPIA